MCVFDSFPRIRPKVACSVNVKIVNWQKMFDLTGLDSGSAASRSRLVYLLTYILLSFYCKPTFFHLKLRLSRVTWRYLIWKWWKYICPNHYNTHLGRWWWWYWSFMLFWKCIADVIKLKSKLWFMQTISWINTIEFDFWISFCHIYC